MGQRATWWTAAAIALVGAATVTAWMGDVRAGAKARVSKPQQTTRRVRTAQVERRPLVSTWEGHGLVRAGDRAALAFTVGGRVRRRPVEVGDRVRRGQELARLDARAFRHAARAAEADLERAESQRTQSENDARRFTSLGEAKAIPTEQVERMQSTLRAAAASEQAARVQLDEAQRALDETTLRAPFDAVVASVHLEPGEMAAAGQAVIVLSGRGAREVEVEVPIETASRMQQGAEADVLFPLSHDSKPLPARICSVGAATGHRAGLLPVVIAIDPSSDRDAVPGAAARVRIPVPQPARLSAPAAAVVDPSGTRPAVLRVRAGQVQRVPVRVDQLLATRVLIEGPLEEGDAVVVSGTSALRDGDRVEVLQ